MLFWFYMLALSLLLPITMTTIGTIFRKKAPHHINLLVGYRTRRSMLSRQTWVFAHRYCGKIWLWSGLILIPIALIAMLCVIGRDTDTVGYMGALLCVLPILTMIGSVIATERALKKNFDPFGFPLRRDSGNRLS